MNGGVLPGEDVQATVRTVNVGGGGTLFRDNGHLLDYPSAALRDSGLVRLRVGQRVRVRLVGGEVVALTLPTFPLPGQEQQSG